MGGLLSTFLMRVYADISRLWWRFTSLSMLWFWVFLLDGQSRICSPHIPTYWSHHFFILAGTLRLFCITTVVSLIHSKANHWCYPCHYWKQLRRRWSWIRNCSVASTTKTRTWKLDCNRRQYLLVWSTCAQSHWMWFDDGLGWWNHSKAVAHSEIHF